MTSKLPAHRSGIPARGVVGCSRRRRPPARAHGGSGVGAVPRREICQGRETRKRQKYFPAPQRKQGRERGRRGERQRGTSPAPPRRDSPLAPPGQGHGTGRGAAEAGGMAPPVTAPDGTAGRRGVASVWRGLQGGIAAPGTFGGHPRPRSSPSISVPIRAQGITRGTRRCRRGPIPSLAWCRPLLNQRSRCCRGGLLAQDSGQCAPHGAEQVGDPPAPPSPTLPAALQPIKL